MTTTESFGLGAVQAEYRRNPRTMRLNRVLSILFIGLGLVGLTGGAALAISNPENDIYYLCFGGGTAPLVLGLWAFWQWRREKDELVTILENGVIYRRRNGAETIAWDNVEAISMSITHFQDLGKTAHRYVLQRSDGEEVRIAYDNRVMTEIEELGRTLQREVTGRLSPVLTLRFDKGEAVVFGPFAVSRTQLKNKNDTLSWDEVGRVVVNNGKVTVWSVESQGSRLTGAKVWASVPVRQIPNLFVLIEFLNRFVVVEQESLIETTRARSRR